MRALAEHLVTGHGYRRLGFAAGPTDAPDAVERLTAFSSAVRDRLAHTVDVVPGGDFSEASGRTAARVLLSREAVPEAVACANDQMAIGVIRELQRSGIRVPEDVAVTGFDDIFPGRVVGPALTTVSQPFRELGARAAARLIQRIEGSEVAPRADVLPTGLVIRRSCGCPASLSVPLAGPMRPPGCTGSAAPRLRGGPGPAALRHQAPGLGAPLSPA